MSAVWLVARSHLHRHAVSLLAMSLLTAVVVGIAVGTFAGAARTGTSLQRALEESRYPQGSIDIGSSDPSLVARVRDLPQVENAGSAGYVAVRPVSTDLVAGIDVVGVLPLDDVAFYEIGRPQVLQGRMPDPARSDEVAISPGLAESLGVGLGDRIPVEAYRQSEAFAIFSEPEGVDPTGLTFDAEVVGIGRGMSDITTEEEEAVGVIVLSPAVLEEIGSPIIDTSSPPLELEVGFFRLFVQVVLEEGARDDEALINAVSEIYDGAVSNAFSDERSVVFAEARDTVRVESVALYAVAIAIALAGLLAIGQRATRQIAIFSSRTNSVLSALGFTTLQRALSSFTPSAVALLVGTVLGIAGAVAASGIFPFGLAGEFEPDRGIDLDAAHIVVAAVFLLLLGIGTGSFAWRHAARVRRRTNRPTVTARSSSPSLTMGISFVTDRGRIPVRSALVGAMVGTMGVIGALTFAGSLDRLVQTPVLYGYGWDVHVPLQMGGGKISERELPAVLADERIASVFYYRGVEATIGGGKPIPGITIEYSEGPTGPTLVEGRLPTADTEIAVDATHADERGLDLGDDVTVTGRPGSETTLEIVGLLTGPGFTQFVLSPDDAEKAGAKPAGERGFLISTDAGVDQGDLLHDLRGRFSEVYPVEAPPQIENLAGVREFPYFVAAVLTLLAMAAVGHLLISGVRRRRRDLAILKVIGFRRRQIWSTVAFQGIAVTAVGVLAGIPLGMALGRTSWSVIASALQVIERPNFPVAEILIAIPLALALVTILSIHPARQATALSPAAVLRTE